MVIEDKHICNKCILDSNIPGVQILEDGICSSCHSVAGIVSEEDIRRVAGFYTKKMEALFNRTKIAGHMYDVLALVSGGKDSIVLLNMLKEKYSLNIAALMVVTPFVNERSIKNAEDVSQRLHIDLYKYHVDSQLFKDVLGYAIYHGDQYNLAPNAPCQMCYFFIYWAGIRFAMEMDIPILAGGRDKSQRLNTYISGAHVKRKAEKGLLPYADIRQLYKDAVGEKYGKTIYDLDEKLIARKTYPTEIAPLSFIDYSYRQIEIDIGRIGLANRNLKKIKTTCKAIHLFDYFSYQQFDCPSSIHEWANGFRMGYPELMQLTTADKNDKNLSRQQLLHIKQEYRRALELIVENGWDENQFGEAYRAVILLCPTIKSIYTDDAMTLLLSNVLSMKKYARFFDIVL